MDTTLRTLAELISPDSALPLLRDWISAAQNSVATLEPSPARADALLRTQVTTRSPMGALVYETGGVLIDHGWLRFLGSGHPRLQRSLPSWNDGKADGFLLFADDAAGGFFALNGGAFDGDTGGVHYWPPDSLSWEALDVGYSEFFAWSLSERLSTFYAPLRWANWRSDLATLAADECVSFYPPLWAKEGSVEGSDRRRVPIEEAFGLKREIARTMR